MLLLEIIKIGRFSFDGRGTVSDWLVLIVYIITALLIYLTLRSQLQVQRMQKQSTDIANQLFRIENTPILKGSFQSKSPVDIDFVDKLDGDALLYTLDVTSDKVAKLITFDYVNNQRFVKVYILKKNIPGYVAGSQSMQIQLIVNYPGKESFQNAVSIKFYFTDAVGNAYMQIWTLEFLPKQVIFREQYPEQVFDKTL